MDLQNATLIKMKKSIIFFALLVVVMAQGAFAGNDNQPMGKSLSRASVSASNSDLQDSVYIPVQDANGVSSKISDDFTGRPVVDLAIIGSSKYAKASIIIVPGKYLFILYNKNNEIVDCYFDPEGNVTCGNWVPVWDVQFPNLEIGGQFAEDKEVLDESESVLHIGDSEYKVKVIKIYR